MVSAATTKGASAARGTFLMIRLPGKMKKTTGSTMERVTP
jgi:hypothetical protein